MKQSITRWHRLRSIAEDVLGDVHTIPRVHGNGFIQIGVPGQDARLHIWHPDVPRQKNSTPIHDHTYSFFSTILSGELLNITYEPSYDSKGSYQGYQAQTRSGEDTMLVPIGSPPRRLRIVKAKLYLKGESYFFDAFTFHEARAMQAFTFMIKVDKYKNSSPTVFIHKDEEPDNDFDRFTAGDRKELLRIARTVIGPA